MRYEKGVGVILTKKEAKKLVGSWEGHLSMDRNYRECLMQKVVCPLNKFFDKLEEMTK